MERLIVEHYSHPSIVIYVVFNEGWGQYEVTAVPFTSVIFIAFNEGWQGSDLYYALATSVIVSHVLAALKEQWALTGHGCFVWSRLSFMRSNMLYSGQVDPICYLFCRCSRRPCALIIHGHCKEQGS